MPTEDTAAARPEEEPSQEISEAETWDFSGCCSEKAQFISLQT